MLTPRNQFWVVLLCTVGITMAVSHATSRWMGFRSAPTLDFSYGKSADPAPVFAASSSLGYYGLDWNRISAACGRVVKRFDVPGASPCELEICQQRVPEATACVVVISAFDLDESYFSTYRAAIVPLRQTLNDLSESKSAWPFVKRTLSQYPEYWVRILFPTAGSSTGVMVGLRSRISALLHPHGGGGGEAEAKPVMSGDASTFPTERESGWDRGRLLRNAAGMKVSSQGEHFFNGPKHVALIRMLAQAENQGKAIVLVMPVTPDYQRELLSPELLKEFEASLEAARQKAPGAVWIRMDDVEQLHNGDYFWDLVHLNTYGREIATAELISKLKPVLKPE